MIKCKNSGDRLYIKLVKPHGKSVNKVAFWKSNTHRVKECQLLILLILPIRKAGPEWLRVLPKVTQDIGGRTLVFRLTLPYTIIISSVSQFKNPASLMLMAIHALISRKFPCFSIKEEFSKDDPKFKSWCMCFLFGFIKEKNTNRETISLTKLHIVSFPDCESRAMAVSNPSSSFLCGSDGTEPACNAGDLGSISGLGRSPARGHGNPLQYSCLENPHGQRSLVSYSPWGLSWTRLSD